MQTKKSSAMRAQQFSAKSSDESQKRKGYVIKVFFLLYRFIYLNYYEVETDEVELKLSVMVVLRANDSL